MNKDNRLQKWLGDVSKALHLWLQDIGNEAHLNALQLRVNGLADATRIAGLVNVSNRALHIAEQLAALAASGAPGASNAAPVSALLQEFLSWAARTPHDGNAARSQPRIKRPSVKELSTPPIYLVNNNPLLAEDTAMQLRQAGHPVMIVEDIDQLATLVGERMPAAVILDLEYRDGILSHMAAFAWDPKSGDKRFPLIFMSARGNFDARLAAARAGADCYFTKPIDVAALIDQVDKLIRAKEAPAPRILIVSNDGATAEQYSLVLRAAGMEICLLPKPADIFRVMGEFQPELVLMDVELPSCSGADLSRLIRQNNAYIDIPIVFLLNGNSMPKRLDAIRAGADDFLVKPVESAHLVAALATRAERYRTLRGLIMRDSLTGLYNHSAINECLSREISSTDRHHAHLSLAMLDLDFFKRINDTYGHPVGDQVIRSLSRLLQQRLRRGDVIGRYGGEEFAIILPGTTADVALHVLNQIREEFAQLRHHADESEFTATFSAGLADVTHCSEADALFRAADAALYEAKHNGRNRVETAKR